MSARAIPARAARVTFLLAVVALLATASHAAAQDRQPQPGARSAASSTPLPAFPGAEGYGALALGGRGGRVIPVTSLDDAGPGSLRAALAAPGPRIVVFQVGGVIALQAPLVVDEPFVTIAGQSAPGDGIVLTGAGLRIRASEVVVRGLRIRPGDEAGRPGGAAIEIAGAKQAPARNVVIANCSLSWSDAALISVRRAEDVSIQWNILAESLGAGGQAGGTAMLLAESARRVSVHHNLIAHNRDSTPRISGDTAVDVVNNLLYNWGRGGVAFADDNALGPTQSVVARNYFKGGPDSSAASAVVIDRSTDSRSWIVVAGNHGEPDLRIDPPLLAAGPPAAPAVPVTVEPTGALLPSVLLGAGARAPARDPIDARIVDELLAGAGRLIASPAEVGGPALLAAWEPGATPADGDADGLPDSFEQAHGLNPADPADASAAAPDGYSWIEAYANGLVPAGARHTTYLPIIRR